MTDVTLSRSGKPTLATELKDALASATSVVPPSWPLDRWIAVNPWWGLRHLPAERAVSMRGARAKTSMLMPATFYRDAWQAGRIRQEDIDQARAEAELQVTTHTLLAALEQTGQGAGHGAPSVLDIPVQTGSHGVIEAVRRQVARTCGLFFDSRQSRWLVASDPVGLFESWLKQTRNDLMLDRQVGLPGARHTLKTLDSGLPELTAWALQVLNLAADDLDALSQRLFFELIGWAAWCRGVDWRAGLTGGQSDLCDQLLRILLVWEALGVHLASPDQRHQWQVSWTRFRQDAPKARNDMLWIWHRAYEMGYQRALVNKLKATQAGPEPENAPFDYQAVFCIDVRSEVLRRHLEAACPTAQTIGFAGFFGMPVTHQGLGPEDDVPRLPGLLAPTYRLAESTGHRGRDREFIRGSDQREMSRQTVRKAKYSSLSSFTLVETTGMAWAWKLVRDSLNRNRTAPSRPDPEHSGLFHCHGGDPISDIERVDLAEQLLRGMSLTAGFASLLVFVGHGSHTDNNPHQAGLACGACGGQNGGVNASLAASLVNDPRVRTGLAERGIRIPDFTLAVAAEHCTVTDRVSILDKDRVPDSYLSRLLTLENGFAEAAKRTRRERAAALKLTGRDDEALLQSMVRRTVNWAEPRPEWGLANNASIVFAQRARTRGLDLEGRSFLHDYDPELDPEGKILTALMTAPMVVANWINLQYLGSVAAPDTYGAGNKLLHSVVGGNIGVIEGNDPDLRIGLSYQSVHDGDHWRHEPVRLTVVIDAPRDRIEQVIASQPDVARLVENRWLWLWRFADNGLESYHNGQWQSVESVSQGLAETN